MSVFYHYLPCNQRDMHWTTVWRERESESVSSWSTVFTSQKVRRYLTILANSIQLIRSSMIILYLLVSSWCVHEPNWHAPSWSKLKVRDSKPRPAMAQQGGVSGWILKRVRWPSSGNVKVKTKNACQFVNQTMSNVSQTNANLTNKSKYIKDVQHGATL